MKRMLLSAWVVAVITTTSMAQLSQNIAPVTFKEKVAAYVGDEVPVFQMPEVDVATLLAEDEINHATKLGPFRFGETMDVDIEFHNSGVWSTLPNGDRVWRLIVSSPEAYSLNFVFDGFHMPEGATFHVYNNRGENILGAFTAENNFESGDFATYLIPGDNATLEYFEPAAVSGQGTLGISQVIHAYRDILNDRNFGTGRGGSSGACNNNVVCPEGNPWENEINAVTRIVLGGGLCSGSLITDVPQSGTPYYLTANHCIQGAGSGGNWVFNFNYQTATCNGSTAPNNQSLTGCVIRANNSGSDFALLQLNNTPPANYGVFYAGWDRSGTAPSESVCIHHPAGDPKKISFDEDPATSTNWQGAACWRIADWEDGTTEGGSSGSPLFDQNHRIIGQLFGGQASCSNNVNDYYGRFAVSWDGSSSSNRLRDWLDPQNTGTSTMDGFDPNQPQVAVDAGAQSLSGVEQGAIVCATQVTPVFTLKNSGQNNLTACTINWTVDNVAQTPYLWTGNLATNQTANITFPTQTFTPGNHSLSFTIVSANNGTDLNANNNNISASFTIVDGDEMTVGILTDNYGDETTWEITNAQNQVVASGGGYDDATQYEIPACLPNGCYTFTIYDEFGDGMCCQWGQGGYELLSPDGDLMGSGGQFQDDESIEFCLPFLCAGLNVTASGTDENLGTGGNNGSATATVSGGTPPYTFDWNPGTGNSATVGNLSAGTYTVTVTDDNGCSATAQVTIDNNVGIDEVALARSISVYPNPSEGTLYVEFTDGTLFQKVLVTDVVGRSIEERSVIGETKLVVDLSALANGVYNFHFFTKNSKVTKQVINLKP